MTREIIISADGHATAPREVFTEYLDPAWRDELADRCRPEQAPGRAFSSRSVVHG